MPKKKKNKPGRILFHDLILSIVIWLVFIFRRDIFNLLVVREIFHPTCIFTLIPHALILYAASNAIIRVGLWGTPKAVYVTRKIPHFVILVLTILTCSIFWKPIGYVREIIQFQVMQDTYEEYIVNPGNNARYRDMHSEGKRSQVLIVNHTAFRYFPDVHTLGELVNLGHGYIYCEWDLGNGWYICDNYST